MTIRGEVIGGRKIGRTLGFPTANVAIEEDLKAANGVYISKVTIDHEEFLGLSNIGTKPTVGGTERSLECHILNFEGDIYGKIIEVELLEKLRDEHHFASIEELKRQIEADRERVKNIKIK